MDISLEIYMFCFVSVLKTNDKFQFCVTGEMFPGIKGYHVIFWAFEDDLGGRDGSENYCGFF